MLPTTVEEYRQSFTGHHTDMTPCATARGIRDLIRSGRRGRGRIPTQPAFPAVHRPRTTVPLNNHDEADDQYPALLTSPYRVVIQISR